MSTAPPGDSRPDLVRKRIEVERRKRYSKQLDALVEAVGEVEERGAFAIERDCGALARRARCRR